MRLIIFFLGLFGFYTVEGLYFHIKETERKCFIEEVPDETLVVGKIYFYLFF